MLYFHVTPTRRVQSICKHGLIAARYGAYSTLVGDKISERDLDRHLNFYRRETPCRKPGLCSVVVIDVPAEQVGKYIVDPRQKGFKFPADYRHYRGLKRPIPRQFVKGFAPLEDRTAHILTGAFLRPCPKRPRVPRRYVVRGKLTNLPKLAGVWADSPGT